VQFIQHNSTFPGYDCKKIDLKKIRMVAFSTLRDYIYAEKFLIQKDDFL